VDFSPDGKVLAACSGSRGKAGELQLWDAATGKLQASRKLEKGTAHLRFSPSGTMVATITVTEVRAWDVAGLLKGKSDN
jgi:WD40 repeat protein